jgi:GcrA cell cycle regulator
VDDATARAAPAAAQTDCAGNPGWTPERTELAATMWRSGASAGQNAPTLHVTRNAVMGKVYRMHLPPRTPVTGNTNNLRQSTRRKPQFRLGNFGNRRAFGAAPPPQRPRPWLAEPTLTEIDVPPSQRTPLLDLTDQCCSWPCGDPREAGFGFCGKPRTSGLPYCAAHCRVAYQVPASASQASQIIITAPIRTEAPTSGRELEPVA